MDDHLDVTDRGDTTHLSLCLKQQAIKHYIEQNQNIAQQRGETPEQLWENN